MRVVPASTPPLLASEGAFDTAKMCQGVELISWALSLFLDALVCVGEALRPVSLWPSCLVTVGRQMLR